MVKVAAPRPGQVRTVTWSFDPSKSRAESGPPGVEVGPTVLSLAPVSGLPWELAWACPAAAGRSPPPKPGRLWRCRCCRHPTSHRRRCRFLRSCPSGRSVPLPPGLPCPSWQRSALDRGRLFQTRASSRTPLKKPSDRASESRSRSPSAACWMLSERAGGAAGDRERGVQVAVQVESPGTAAVSGRGVVPDVAGDDCVPDDRVVLSERSRPAGPFLEVGDEPVRRGLDAEEVVHVYVGAVGLRPALCDERNGVGDAAATGVGADAGAFSLEPGLDGESRGAEARGGPEGHVVVRAIEVECRAGAGRRCGRSWCRRRCRRRRRGGVGVGVASCGQLIPNTSGHPARCRVISTNPFGRVRRDVVAGRGVWRRAYGVTEIGLVSVTDVDDVREAVVVDVGRPGIDSAGEQTGLCRQMSQRHRRSRRHRSRLLALDSAWACGGVGVGVGRRVSRYAHPACSSRSRPARPLRLSSSAWCWWHC